MKALTLTDAQKKKLNKLTEQLFNKYGTGERLNKAISRLNPPGKGITPEEWRSLLSSRLSLRAEREKSVVTIPAGTDSGLTDYGYGSIPYYTGGWYFGQSYIRVGQKRIFI